MSAFAPYHFLLPEAIIVMGALLLLATSSWKVTQTRGNFIAAATLIVAQIILFGLSTASAPTLNFFYFDSLSLFARSVIVMGTAIILFMPFEEEEPLTQAMPPVEHHVLLLLCCLGMMVMVSAYDFLALYLGLELVSLSLAILVASKRKNEASLAGGLKYFVLSAVASVFFLYGMAMLYGFGGETHFANIANLAVTPFDAQGAILLLSVIFILSAMAFKMAAAPFHFWAPDVYQGAPTHVTLLLATLPKITAFIVFMRLILVPFKGFFDSLHALIIVMAVASMLIGSLSACATRDVKRLLAYSSIAHIGFALIGVVAGTQEGASGALSYMLIYVLMAFALFALLLIMRLKGRLVQNIDELAGLSSHHPWLAAAFAIVILSMAGLPPLAGFFIKLQVFFPAIGEGYLWVVMAAIVSTAIGCYYYLRLLKIIYFDQGEGDWTVLINHEAYFLIFIISLVMILFGIAPALLWQEMAIPLAIYGAS